MKTFTQKTILWLTPLLVIFLGNARAQYCSVSFPDNVEPITLVQFGTINNATSATLNGTPPLEDFTAISTTVLPNSIIPITVKGNTDGSYTNWIRVYVDWNQDLDFDDPGEFYDLGSIYGSTGLDGVAAVGNITVPITAISGTTRMRVMKKYGSSTNYAPPCNTTGYGQAEDYTIEVIPLAGCSGMPDPVTITGPTVVCPNTPFSLIATNMTIGANIEYQWEEDNGLGFTPIPGATTTTYNHPGISTLTEFRFITTCTAGGDQDISNTLSVDIDDFFNCYCTSEPNYTQDGEIFNVSISTLNNTSTCAQTGGPGSILNKYSDYTSVLPAVELMQTVIYPISVTAGACGTNQYDAWVKVWMDFNHDGIFDDDPAGTELVYSGTTPSTKYTPAGELATGFIEIPATALTGITRMRVILWQANNGAIVTPCQQGSPYNYGETEDYLVDILPAIPCSSTPDPVTVSGPTDVCQGESFQLEATGVSVGGGIEYQWQYDDNGTWTDIVGATLPVYINPSGITATTDFRFVTTCTNGGAQDVSNTVTVEISPFYKCYCTTSYLNGGGNDYIGEVELENLLHNTSALGNVFPYYHDYTDLQPASLPIPDLAQGFSYDLHLSFGADGTQYHMVWIDLDQNGVFDDTESYVGTPNPAGINGSATISIFIPLTATPGITRMRIRGAEDVALSDTQACGASSSNYGETEDYLVNIYVPTTCMGTPDPVTVTGPSQVCPNTSFQLSATGATVEAGIEYQWQYDDNGTWTDILGATHVNYTHPGITAATDFRFVTTCINGGAQDISSVYTVDMESFYNCYCTSYANYVNDGEIYNVTLGALNNSSTCAQTGGPGSMINQYSDYTTLVPAPQLMQGVGYQLSVTVGACGAFNYPAWVKVWIDFNHDGIFDNDPSGDELIFSGTTPSTYYTPAGEVASGTITIPISALTGTTRMRVILWQATSGASVIPCQQGAPYNYGETEDYLVEIIPTTLCTGAPDPVTIIGPADVCEGSNFVLSASGMTVASGIEYQWQYDDNGTWTDITGATQPAYMVVGGISASVDYRFVTVCTTTGDEDVSNVITVDIAPASNCLCIPDYNTGCDEGDDINSFTLTGEGSTSISNLNTGCASGAYDDRRIETPVILAVNNSYSGTINSSYTGVFGGAEYARMWIDLNVNGIFENTEEVATASNYLTSATSFTLTIPATATPGTYVLRVKGEWDDGSYTASDIDPCTSFWGYGETHDYLVEIVDAPLSIHLGELKATHEKGRNRLEWNTHKEDRGDYFILEKSTDGSRFIPIGTIAANGKPSVYTYWDDEPIVGNNYYRLKMLDASENISYSNVASVRVAATESTQFYVEAYPNPIQDMLHIRISGTLQGNAQILITDVAGKLIQSIPMKENQIEVDMRNLSSGVYLIKYVDDARMQTLRISKE